MSGRDGKVNIAIFLVGKSAMKFVRKILQTDIFSGLVRLGARNSCVFYTVNRAMKNHS